MKIKPNRDRRRKISDNFRIWGSFSNGEMRFVVVKMEFTITLETIPARVVYLSRMYVVKYIADNIKAVKMYMREKI